MANAILIVILTLILTLTRTYTHQWSIKLYITHNNKHRLRCRLFHLQQLLVL